MVGKLKEEFFRWLPLLFWGTIFAVVALAFVFGGSDDGGQVCSETGVADSADYPSC